ncbi:hypothetical protein [Natronoglycomyces albus]|uniref:Uncharacterized protein n=1 Tax=Natronoglycomyces albus TaxID=2811108 RepID=A0A895XRK9_9ACTN|nr:hypothetical protein [Natronoglycomyces albus]QSB05979.1 hypothetical protein JQS30_03375 [Natronoglycomyces albus]
MQENLFTLMAGDLAQFGPERDGALAGPIGMVIIMSLLAVTVLLVMNMSKRVKRLPQSFDHHEDANQSSDDRPASS